MKYKEVRIRGNNNNNNKAIQRVSVWIITGLSMIRMISDTEPAPQYSITI